MIRTLPLGTTGPRRQPTLLGFIRVELELKTATPRPQPRPARRSTAGPPTDSPTRKSPADGRASAVRLVRQEARQSAAVTDSLPMTER